MQKAMVGMLDRFEISSILAPSPGEFARVTILMMSGSSLHILAWICSMSAGVSSKLW
jgi:hypothetical protein